MSGKSGIDVSTKVVTSPISEAIWDTERETQLWQELGLYPYFGGGKYTSHRSLKLLYDLSNNSPSHNTVIKFYENYAVDKFAFFEDRLNCIDYGSEDAQFDNINLSEQERIVNELQNTGFDFNLKCAITKEHLFDSRVCGTFYLVIEELEIDGQKAIRLEYKSPLRVMRLKPETAFSKPEAIIFKSNMLRSSKDEESKKYYEVLPLYPNWKKTSLGRRTIIQEKNSMGIYGRPPDKAAIRPKYIEYSNLDTACKIGAKAVTTMLLAFFQEEQMQKIQQGPADDCDEKVSTNPYELRAEAIREIITSQGEGHTVAAIPYSGPTPPTFQEISLVRDTAWWKNQIETAGRLILQENTVPISLAQSRSSSNDLGGRTGNQMSKEFKMFCLTAVRNQQICHEALWNKVLKIWIDFHEIQGLNKSSIKYTNKVKQLLEVETQEEINIRK